MRQLTVAVSDSASQKLAALKRRFGSYRVAVEIAIERLWHQEFPGGKRMESEESMPE